MLSELLPLVYGGLSSHWISWMELFQNLLRTNNAVRNYPVREKMLQEETA